ncbi:hypothetical protein HMPREF9336_02171 [Segniliparus rugosus ATCC BAA-974]|uniref:Uncharacterized protein n=2 Tax=Segniliparus rugosus TaxID=286804 RepID=E5XRP9_SEGRC|nr:hypothetical protein HMPREF9336_02171 [Segniliparus rugosus ATCC BAA-974]
MLATGNPATSAASTREVRYVMRADGPWQARIVYHVDRTEPDSGGSNVENVWLDPEHSWETTLTMEDPYNWAGVHVTGLSYLVPHPVFHCEIWVDGTLADHSLEPCALLPGPPFT